jgi:succinate dehydrogenase/fumarate reductase flavoprotein subunit
MSPGQAAADTAQPVSEYDVVVVGAGTAGLPCAIAAAEAGALVLIVEKADRIGGTLHLSGGHMSGAGARRQLEAGIEGDTPAAHFDDIARISEHTAKRHDLIELAVTEAAATIDWLDDNGFEFDPRTPRIVYGHEPYGAARTFYGVDEGRSTLATLTKIIEPHIEAGRITIRTSCTVRELIVEDRTVEDRAVEDRTVEGRRVVGVEVSGEPGRVSAGAVVLATGGFGANPELFAELDGRGAPLVSAAAETSTGDGLIMARKIGAQVAGVGDYLPTFGGMPHPDDPGRVQWVDRPLLVAEERDPWEIYVDRHGKRFIAEDDPSVDRKERALTTVDNLTFWMIFDERAVAESANIVVGWSADDMRQRANVRAGIHRADTVRELAELAGIDADGLANTVARYNDAIAAEAADEFDRTVRPAPIIEAPFYAMKNHGITLITFAGLDVDADFSVRSSDGTAISGLYAIGELLGSSATMGNSFCSGMLVGPCLTFGRLLGARLGHQKERGSL